MEQHSNITTAARHKTLSVAHHIATRAKRLNVEQLFKRNASRFGLGAHTSKYMGINPMRFLAQSILLAGSVAVSACSGGGDTPTMAAPVGFSGKTETVWTPPVVTQASATSRTIARQSGSTVQTWTAARKASFDTGDFIVFGGGSNNPLLFESDTAAGGRAELSMIVNDTGSSPAALGGKITTVGGTMPQTGTATYSGDYVGFITRSGPAANLGLTDTYVKGDVSLDANFAAQTVSGAITNRVRHLTATGAMLSGLTPGDVTLGQVNFDQNSGGRLSAGTLLEGNPRFVPAAGTLTGSWEVGFNGPEAAEALGTVLVQHDYLNGGGSFNSDDYLERGVFTATKQ